MFKILSVLVKQWPVTCDLCFVPADSRLPFPLSSPESRRLIQTPNNDCRWRSHTLCTNIKFWLFWSKSSTYPLQEPLCSVSDMRLNTGIAPTSGLAENNGLVLLAGSNLWSVQANWLGAVPVFSCMSFPPRRHFVLHLCVCAHAFSERRGLWDVKMNYTNLYIKFGTWKVWRLNRSRSIVELSM